jgi:DNA modification methylase
MSLSKPFYQDDWVKIFLGDARDFISDFELKSINLATDPPYGIGEAAGKNKSRGQITNSKDYGNNDWDDKPVDQSLIDSLVNLADKSIIFGGNYYLLPPTSCWLVWDKDNGKTDFADYELAWTNLNIAVRRLKWRWNGMLQEDMSNKEPRIYPTQKPLAVMKWALSFLKSDKPVLDSFCGSGTTLFAAKMGGVKSIGIDKREVACEIAAKRCMQTVMNFDIPKIKVEQASYL